MDVERKRNAIINVLYLFMVLALVYVIFKYLIYYIMPFLIGLLIALLLGPLIGWMARKLRMKTRLAATISVTLFYIIVGTLITVFAVVIINFIASVAQNLSANYTTQIQPYLTKILALTDFNIDSLDADFAALLHNISTSITSAVGDGLKALSTTVMGWAASVVSNIPSFLINMLFTIISTFFIASDFDHISSFVLRQMPDRTASLLVQGKKLLGSVLGKYARSYSLILGITFIELSIGFAVLGVNNFLLVAFLVAIMDILPVVGTGLVLLPWGIISLIQGNIGRGIGLLVVYVIITVVRNIVEPRIVGNNVGLHPLATLMAMYVGTRVLGGIGLFGLPISLSILRILNEKGAIHIYKPLQEETPGDDQGDSPDTPAASDDAAISPSETRPAKQ